MKVELELFTDDEDESAVMDKVSEVARYAKQQGFRIDEIELERDKDDDEDDEEESEKKDAPKSRKRKIRRRKRRSTP